MTDLDLKVNRILDKISQTVAALDIPATAKMEGVRLAETWIAETSKFDLQYETVAVELPFFFFADKYTIVVGQLDRFALDDDGLFGCEWKTTKGKTRYWNEEKWLENIRNGHQIAIYALAQRLGYFVVPSEFTGIGAAHRKDIVGPDLWHPQILKPRTIVRAITKDTSPQIWPSDGQAMIEFSEERLHGTLNALIVKGAQIRAAKGLGLVPWQLPGLQCENRFSHQDCKFLESCRTFDVGSGLPALIGATDPGAKALPAAENMLGLGLNDDRIAVISASSYEDMSNCMEYYRRTSSGESPDHHYQKELDKGTALHAALGTYYEEMRV